MDSAATPLVRIAKNWGWPSLSTLLPAGSDSWGDVRFTEEEVDECDYLLVLNRVTQAVHTRVPPENVWLLIQEPALPDKDFVSEGHERFARVLTHHMIDDSSRYVRSHPATPWHIRRTYDELIASSPPLKPEAISVIASDLAASPGHQLRWQFVQRLRELPEFRDHTFGKGIRYIEDKWDGLAPYRYSVAIENSSSSDYWTEKLADCFLAWTVPLYFGCTNIFDYFPERSLIWLPVDRPDEALEILRQVREKDDWQSRLGALREARELVLNRYQFFPHLSRIIREHYANEGRYAMPRAVRLPVRESAIRYRVRRRLRQARQIVRRWHGGSTDG